MRGSRRGLCACRHVKRSSFAGAGAKTRSTSVNTGARDSDSAPAYARREPSQSRSEARFVRLTRSSSAADLPGQAAQGHPVNTGRDAGAAFFWFLFLAAQEKELAAGLPPASLLHPSDHQFTRQGKYPQRDFCATLFLDQPVAEPLEYNDDFIRLGPRQCGKDHVVEARPGERMQSRTSFTDAGQGMHLRKRFDLDLLQQVLDILLDGFLEDDHQHFHRRIPYR